MICWEMFLRSFSNRTVLRTGSTDFGAFIPRLVMSLWSSSMFPMRSSMSSGRKLLLK